LVDTVFWGGGVATMRAGGAAYGAIEDAALWVRGGRIAWVGERGALPAEALGPDTAVHELAGRWITPALIDCHTHLVFAGNRSLEFEERLGGVSYEAASRQGRGILSTVAATRAASEASLVESASRRLESLMRDGVMTVEIKSGYGLCLETELAMLRAARALGRVHGVRVRTSFLGAHAIPQEYAGRSDAYVDLLVEEMLPAVAAEGLADAVDGFAEAIAFSTQQIGRVFAAAQRLGLPVKLHADQLTDGGGAALAASFGALSADHLEYTSEAGVRAMSQAGTVAVLLPGAFATVGAHQPPPVPAFRTHGVAMAVATDCNPGSSPLCSLRQAMNLACCLFRMTPEEALAGVTRHAAKALGIAHEVGSIEPGKLADLLIWDIGHPREISYWMGGLAPVVWVR
jgi:imidazolonepropionase